MKTEQDRMVWVIFNEIDSYDLKPNKISKKQAESEGYNIDDFYPNRAACLLACDIENARNTYN